MTQISKEDPASACCSLDALIDPRLFKALCDPNRIAILVGLAGCRGSRTVGEIAADRPVDVSVVSRHLAMLRDAGVLEAQRRGKEVHYRVRVGPLVRTLRSIADALERCCPEPSDSPDSTVSPPGEKGATHEHES